MNEKAIWDFLYPKLLNSFGVAALMGNLYVESKLNPRNLQGSAEKKLNMTDESYTNAVDSGLYPSFTTDGAGYGLAQWTYRTRKQALLEFAQNKGSSIGDLNTQLEFLWSELQSYKTCLAALKNAVSVREASDVVVDRYEKPADRSEKGKQNRANYGQRFYNEFAAKKPLHLVEILTNKVNIRRGNSKEYPVIIQTGKADKYEWIATAENGWHAVKLVNQVGWVSGEFSKIISNS